MSRVADPVHGVLLLDKPTGISSNQALQRVRYALGAAKGGHTGSLDPLATGMLPLCFGEATKVAGLLLGARKRYRARIRLGVVTATDDAEGEVIDQSPVGELDQLQIEKALSRFLGCIQQRPPVYSALKQQGVPLYKRARRGEEVHVSERQVEVFAIEAVRLEGVAIECEIECGSGTYIRSIARDLGEKLGCGGHLAALRRLWVDPFQDREMLTLDAILDAGQALRARLMTLTSALAHLHGLALDENALERFRQGQKIAGCEDSSGRDPVAVRSRDGTVAGLGRVDSSGVLHASRVFAAAAG